MKKNEVYTGKVTEYEFPNKGIIYEEDCKITVKNALIGQTVSYRLQKKRKTSGQGRLLSVEEKSYLETEKPFCPNFGSCGSCIYQGMTYENQLDLKRKITADLIDGVCEDYIFDGIKGSPDIYAYRNKMEYSFGDECKDGKMVLGLHKRGSFYDILPASCCMLVHEDFGKILSCVIEYCTDNNLPYFHKVTHEGYLRHLLVRRANSCNEILVDIVTSSQINHDFSDLADALLKLDIESKIAGILHTVNDSEADAVKDGGTSILYGKEYITENLLGLDFKITPFSFFQTNSAGAEVLYSIVRDYIGGAASGRIVYDLYSGTGTIAQLLAPSAKKVIGVEIVGEAVEAARLNAERNGLDNCSFICGDVLKVLEDIDDAPDVIVLDPPREGVHPKALAKILDYGVENIIYISCKPTSLARDLVVMKEAGYNVERVSMVDMFAWTAHVETVVLLSKGEVDSKKIRVEFSLEDMDMSEFQDGATYPQIKEYVLEHTGLKVSNLYISQIKRKCGIEVGKNYNLPKSEDSRQPQCPPEKEKAIREAFKYFGMI